MPLDLFGLARFLMCRSRYRNTLEVIELPENVSTTLGETVEFPRQPARPCSADSRRFNNLCFNEDLQLLLNGLSRFVLVASRDSRIV